MFSLHDLWDTAVTGTKDAYITDSKVLGVQDTINKDFVDMLKDRKRPQDIDKIMAIAEHQHDRLFNPFLRLLGKCIFTSDPVRSCVSDKFSMYSHEQDLMDAMIHLWRYCM
jgi:hypothetical protein